jgi:geranylgeranyl reductase family protein
MMESFDVAVIGSGPAGAMAAYEAASKNLSVLMIEKETLPRYKTCGGGLVHRGRRKIPFDISETLEKEFHEIEVFFENSDHYFVTKRSQPIISMVMRDQFDAKFTQQAVEMGVRLIENTQLLSIDFGETMVLKTNRGMFKSRYLIAADGALSPTAKMAGWKDSRTLIPALEFEVKVGQEDFLRLSKKVRFDVDTVPYGYAWCFPKSTHLSLGVCCLKKQKIDLRSIYKDYLKKLGITEVIEETGHGFQIPIAPRNDGFVKQQVFLVGDAAGFADPLTAEGISNAIYSGQLASAAIASHFNHPDLASTAYQANLEKKLLPELKTSNLLGWIFYAQPKMRNRLINRFGQKGCEYLTDVFMGEKAFPDKIKQKLKQHIPLLRFS